MTRTVSVIRDTGGIVPTIGYIRDPDRYFPLDLPYGEVYPVQKHRNIREIADRPDVAAQLTGVAS